MKRMMGMMLAVLVLMSSFACAETAVDIIMNTGTTQSFTDEAVSSDDLEKLTAVWTPPAAQPHGNLWKQKPASSGNHPRPETVLREKSCRPAACRIFCVGFTRRYVFLRWTVIQESRRFSERCPGLSSKAHGVPLPAWQDPHIPVSRVRHPCRMPV